ncbi:MAG: GIY-YIG nuclease family protein [Nitrospirae bacterium]|nr:GIY-YIG nuclease family protein [Nitrospirota bacterium]
MEIWFLYLIRCRDGSLYTGITTDVKRRFKEHKGGSRGSKYLRGKAPLQLVLKKKIGDKGLALKVEDRVKKLTKNRKELLVEGKIVISAIKRAI